MKLSRLQGDLDVRLQAGGMIQAWSEKNGKQKEEFEIELYPGKYFVQIVPGKSVTNSTYRFFMRFTNIDLQPLPRNLTVDVKVGNITNSSRWLDATTSASNKHMLFSFNVPSQTTVRADLEGMISQIDDLDSDVDLAFFDWSSNRLAVSERDDVVPERIITTLEAGWYYILVYSDNGNVSRAKLRLQATANSPRDDAGVSARTARDVGPGGYRTFQGEKVGAGDGDLYRITLTKRDYVTATVRLMNEDVDVEIYDINDNLLDISDRSGTQTDQARVLVDPGIYFIWIYAAHNKSTLYTLEINHPLPPANQ